MGDGLAVFLELGIELTGQADPATGLIVNVSDIDGIVRQHVVGIFAEKIRADYREAHHIGYDELAGMLKDAWGKLTGKFGDAKVTRLSLKLNPFKTLTVDERDCAMIYLSEKFEFAAAHKLWNDKLSEQQNIDTFGRCANPAGHGHNYIVEVTVKQSVGQKLPAGDFEKVVYEEFIRQVDHKNLNVDIPEFGRTTPTVENIAEFAWKKLNGKFGKSTLHCVTIWETEKTYSSYYG
jgi:6-pyruvoyltetrahydropterin/6-carboxytetrahydropterin synthase